MKTFDEICESIVLASKNGLASKDQISAILEPWSKQQAEALNAACVSLHNLWKSEGDWRFRVADGMTATVHFSGTPNKMHLKAFVAVFSVMADSYCEPEGFPMTPRTPEQREAARKLAKRFSDSPEWSGELRGEIDGK